MILQAAISTKTAAGEESNTSGREVTKAYAGIQHAKSKCFLKFISISFDQIKLTAAISTTTAAGGASNISAGRATKTSAGGRRGAVATAATGGDAAVGEKSDSRQIYLLIIYYLNQFTILINLHYIHLISSNLIQPSLIK